MLEETSEVTKVECERAAMRLQRLERLCLTALRLGALGFAMCYGSGG